MGILLPSIVTLVPIGKGRNIIKIMKLVQSALRISGVARNVIPKRTNVSMKQSYDIKSNVGLYPASASYNEKIIKTQQEWAKTPHLFVWQKRGAVDMIPLYLTYGLCFFGMAYIMKKVYKMSFPPKQQ